MTMDDLGARLRERYESVLAEQVQQVLARRIRVRVGDARADPDRASRRWPFELIQNAHDAKEREGRQGIAVAFEYVEGRFTFSHDAAPFNMGDLAALLTGGSSKDFDSKETTGRFGTGFLVTHVLSERAQVAGILQEDNELRSFVVELHRPPDELEILNNITASKIALTRTQPVVDFAERPTTTVTYQVDDPRLVHAGLDMLEECLPYLFASCRRLGEVRIRRDSRTVHWRVAERGVRSNGHKDIVLEEILVRSEDSDGRIQAWRVVRASRDSTARGWLLLAVRKSVEGWQVWEPPRGVPRIFRQLPVIGAPLLSTWVILDGEFDLDQERSNIHVIGEHSLPLRDALDALGGLAMFTKGERWTDAHQVGRLSMPPQGLGQEATEVWREVLSVTARRLAGLPLVDTVRQGALSAVKVEDDGGWVDFIAIESKAATDHDQLWSLAERCITRDPPMPGVSEGWSAIAHGWEQLGVKISWLDLQDVGRWAREDSVSLKDLKVTGDPYDWLSRYLNAVGHCWANGIKKQDVFGLLPDQHQRLKNADVLRRDAGVSDRIKTIAEMVGYDVRGLLVDSELVRRLEVGELTGALSALTNATGGDMDEAEAVDELTGRLSSALPAERPVADDRHAAVAASLELLGYLWDSQGADGHQAAWKIPLVTRDRTACLASPHRMLLPPVAAWPDTARPFATAFPLPRILSDDYSNDQLGGMLVEALVEWGIAHKGLVGKIRRKELRDRALRAIAMDGADVDGAKPLDCVLSQIALLEPEVINHCKQSRKLAQELLGLVVCHVARVDSSWRTVQTFEFSTTTGTKPVQLIPCLWLADLRSKPWIPVEAGGDVTVHIPNPAVLRDLIEPKWLENNADGAELLVRHFGMDALDVQLLAVASDEASRKAIRDELAKLVEIAGADPKMLAGLAQRAGEWKRDDEILENIEMAEQLAGILTEFHLSSVTELRQVLARQATGSLLPITQEILVNMGISSVEEWSEAIKDKNLDVLFSHKSTPTTDMFVYAQSLITKAKRKIIEHLRTLPSYDLAQLDETAPTVLAGVLKEGRAVTIVVRPAYNREVIIYYGSERDVLDYEDSELWVDDGVEPRRITLGHILKTAGIRKFPV
jgi:hypothetical protein